MPRARNGQGAKRILNCLPSQKTEKDWRIQDAIDGGALTAVAALPASKDLRESWWKIGDQGSTGSCVGWATADSVLRWHYVKANRLSQNQLLSVRFIWMAAKETDEFVTRPSTFIEDDGTSLKAALDVSRKLGVVPETVLPFGTATGSWHLFQGTANAFYAQCAQRKIASYYNLGTTPGNWRNWLASSGPILTRLGVDATWDNATATHGNLDAYQPNTVRGGHAVALVGYTHDRFIVRNSWGTQWGDKGFGYASIAYAQAAFTEAYGVLL